MELLKHMFIYMTSLFRI